jgi:ATP-dependent Clp protease ATP-binding subunit ClpC
VFERFTDQARQVVVLAQEEARGLGHQHIGTEHLLLGVLREEDGIAARALRALGVQFDRARAHVLELVGPGEPGGTSGQIPFTPRGKKVLELSLREALALHHDYIGTEHILLGLVRESEGVGARVLLDFDIDSQLIRDEVIRLLDLAPAVSRRGRLATLSQLTTRALRSIREPGPASASGLGADLDALFVRVGHEIASRLGRDPDTGDLLVILATLPEGVVARALTELGIDEAALDAALTRARAAGPDSIDERIELVRAQKDAALDGAEFETAARLREEERRLSAEREDEILPRVRARLGLSDERQEPPVAGVSPG